MALGVCWVDGEEVLEVWCGEVLRWENRYAMCVVWCGMVCVCPATDDGTEAQPGAKERQTTAPLRQTNPLLLASKVAHLARTQWCSMRTHLREQKGG